MPQKTFFNLPKEKKEQIIQVALNEFSQNSFDNVKISNIVEKAGIPRGSFYQYFSDLEDLYKYIFQLIGEKKMEFLNLSELTQTSSGTFELLKNLYQSGLDFAREHPELAQIGNNFFRENYSFRKKILGEHLDQSRSIFSDIITRGIKRGEIDPDIDVNFITYLLFQMNLSLVDYLLEQKQKENPFSDTRELSKLSGKLLCMIENGIKKKDREGE